MDQHTNAHTHTYTHTWVLVQRLLHLPQDQPRCHSRLAQAALQSHHLAPRNEQLLLLHQHLEGLLSKQPALQLVVVHHLQPHLQTLLPVERAQLR